MSNFPDNMDHGKLDVSPKEEQAYARLDNFHQVYRDVLTALTDSCIRNRVHMGREDIEAIMQVVPDSMANDADSTLGTLPNETCEPDDAQKLIDKAHERLVDSFRIRPIDYKGVFDSIFSPAVLLTPKSEAGHG